MSYRTYVNGTQIMGNNEYSINLINELKKQGCKLDEEECFENFELKELQPIIEALERHIISKYESLKSFDVNIADFTENLEKADKENNITFAMETTVNDAYIFTSVNFLKAIEGLYIMRFDREANRLVYHIKPNCKVVMSAY